MTGILGKIFGGKKKKDDGVAALVEDILQRLIEVANFELSFNISEDRENNDLNIELFGADEELLISRDGQLMDSIQLYLRRVVQHRMPDERINVNVDAGEFRAQANEALIELADKLREIALAKGKSVYFRALAPKDRKVVHQYLAEDSRVKSRSVGEGHFKKIKIYPVKGADDSHDSIN